MPAIQERVLIAPYTTFGIGGEAEYFAVASSEDELAASINQAREQDWSVTILGGCSNMLVSDSGVKGLVIIYVIKGIVADPEGGSVKVIVGAGEVWDDLVAHTVEEGWWGLENLSAIPGTVGATPIQNVGAYGVEVKEMIEAVRVYSPEREDFLILTNAECRFSYRDSFFKSPEGKNLIVVGVTYRLSLKPTPILHYKDLAMLADEDDLTQENIRAAVISIRAEKFPNWHELGTAGSYFKNPIISEAEFVSLQAKYPELPGFSEPDGRVKVSLGWVLDKICGFKGVRDGNVGTFKTQALALVNYGGATAEEVLGFEKKIASEVKERTGIIIEREPVLIG